AELDLLVHDRLHRRVARIAEDAACAEGARPEFHPSLKPADDLLARQQVGDVIAQFLLAGKLAVRGVRGIQARFDLARGVVRAEQRALLAVARVGRASVAEKLIPDEERHAQRTASVSRGGLDPYMIEWPLPQNSSVADA